MSAIGMCTRAERKVMVPPRSAAARHSTVGDSACGSLRAPPLAAMSAKPSEVVKRPRRKIASPVGKCPAAIFISVSLTTNTAIDASMARMPRRLSERAGAGRARLIEGCSAPSLTGKQAGRQPRLEHRS